MARVSRIAALLWASSGGMMDITLLAYGSRGDIEPFVALGQGLVRAGYRVRLVAPEVFASLALGSDIDFVGLPGDPEQLVRGLVETGSRRWAGTVRSVAQYVMPLATQVLETVQAACAGTDAVIHSFLLTIAGSEIARARGIPDISVQLFPVFTPTTECPGIVFPDLPLGDPYRRVTHWVLKQTFWQGSRILYRRLRRVTPHFPRLTGWPLDVRSERPSPILYAFSPQIVPRPHDWRDGTHVTGYWFPQGPLDWQSPQELTDFLEAGPPPVCVSFGSTLTRERDRLVDTVFEALTLSRRRGVIVGPALQVDRPPESVFWLDYAPYGWLFPRAAAVVHHGGAGTTAQGLRAGVPNVVVPFTSDQPFWGQRVASLGAGPQPIPVRRLSAERLARAIIAATSDEEMRYCAERIGRAVRAEDGVGKAVGIIDRYLSVRGLPPVLTNSRG